MVATLSSGCSSAYYASSARYASDDLYVLHDRTQIARKQQAEAEAIKMLNAAGPDAAVIAIKSLESLQKIADGKSTKIIIPSEIQGLAGLATSFKELIKDDKTEK